MNEEGVPSLRISEHATLAIIARDLPIDDVLRAATEPDAEAPARFGRRVRIRRYEDPVLGRTMLMRVFIETSGGVTTIVTAYRTSKIQKYLRGQP